MLAGDLATLFMLEDRVSARTDAGQDCLDGSPTCIPYSPTYLAQVLLVCAQGLVFGAEAERSWLQVLLFILSAC